MKRWLKNQKGLTLVELLAVIVILGVIAAIAVPSIGGIINNTKKSADVQSEALIKDAAERFAYDTGKTSSQSPLTVNIQTDLVATGYLKSLPTEQESGKAYNQVTVTFNATSGWTATTITTVD